ncbi:MAG: hypothetical protein GQ534_11680, partial [Candidatus Delongbacteria bacterium]|nr:hypothetical protein [Candidatus Delongbacteria bacterium]
MKAMKLLIIVLFISAIQLFSQFPGTALEFDGVDEFVSISDNASLDITNAITIEAWIYANTWKANHWDGTIVGKDGTDKTGYNLRCGDNGSLSFVNGIAGDWPEAVSSQIMSTNEWYHVAGVYDGSSQKVYINGELVAENLSSGTIGVNTNNLQIGDSQGYPGRLFDGKIDEVRIWNIARTETEIQDNMYSSLDGTETGLIAYYELDEGTGMIAGDTAGSNDGTLTNMEEEDWVGSIPPPSVVLLSNPGSFTLVTGNFNGIDVGQYSSPTIADIDGNGLFDMLVGEGNGNGNINHYEQNAINNTEFTLVTESFNGINVGNISEPIIIDIDGDRLLDMLVGEWDGNINHYEQNSLNSTSFTLVTTSFNSIDVGYSSAPTFTDLDGDGLLDMLVGEYDGNINHYEQNSLNSTSFTLVTANFNSIDVGRSSKPTFADLDGNGLLDMLIGEDGGNINHYKQDAENSLSFSLITENFNGINLGLYGNPISI